MSNVQGPNLSNNLSLKVVFLFQSLLVITEETRPNDVIFHIINQIMWIQGHHCESDKPPFLITTKLQRYEKKKTCHANSKYNLAFIRKLNFDSLILDTIIIKFTLTWQFQNVVCP